jgi:hypothetical protein
METLGYVVAAVAFLIILALVGSSGSCSVCGLSIRRKSYQWKIGNSNTAALS